MEGEGRRSILNKDAERSEENCVVTLKPARPWSDRGGTTLIVTESAMYASRAARSAASAFLATAVVLAALYAAFA